MLKRILLAVLMWPLLVLAQSYPSPTLNNLTVNGTVTATAIGSSTAGTGAFTKLTASNGISTVYATDTGSPTAGVHYYLDNLWSPSGATGQFNNFWQIHIPSVSLNGGTVQQRWNSSNQLVLIDTQTTGPTGTPSSPSGMADSHTIGNMAVLTIPAGLCDGQNGSGFTGPGGSPGNNCYQEIGGFASVNTVLSPGHYAEGIASTINDNNGGAGVPIRGTAFLANVSKNSATNTYNTYGYAANSVGSQQGANAPTAAFVVQGGWQTSLDLSQNTSMGSVPIKLPGGQTINSDANNIYFGIGGTNGLTVNSGGIVGSTSGSVAPSGNVGERLFNTKTGTSLTPNTAANATSKTLPPGDWDVQCIEQFNSAGSTTSTNYWNSVSTTSATLSGSFSSTSLLQMPAATGVVETIASPVVPITVSSNTTVYCVAQASFGVSTMTVDGYIRAVRVR